MFSGNGKQLSILVISVVCLVAFLAYGNIMKHWSIDSVTNKAHKQELFNEDIVHKYQDCLRSNQNWGAKYDSQRQVAEDYKNRFEGQTDEHRKSEQQMTEALATAKARIRLLEGELQALKSGEGQPSSQDKAAATNAALSDAEGIIHPMVKNKSATINSEQADHED